jgi:BCD family chlorophyll transporter-like MFS transporter
MFWRGFNYVRLAALPLSLTLISILAGSVINRVMVVELGLPVTLAGLFIAIPLLIAPVRVWLGYRSDAYPLRGLRREPYIILGAFLAGISAAAAVILVLNTSDLISAGAVGILVALLVYGIGKNLANNTFQALIADKFEAGPKRSRAANLYEVVRMVGLIMAAGMLGVILQPYSAERLTTTVVVMAIVATLLAIVATVRQEPRTAILQEAGKAARAVNFKKVVKELVWDDPQARLFFTIVMLTLMGTQMQDVLLEPYGALVFGMNVGQTTQLTAFWGVGTLIAILLSGLFLLKKFGNVPVFRVGLILVIVLFPGIILAGLSGNSNLLRLLVVGLGLGTGLSAASLLAQMVDFTTLRRAGLLVGVWGVAHQFGRALASLAGGVLVDGMLLATEDNALISYGAAFALEAVVLVAAFVLIGRLDISASLAVAEEKSEVAGFPSASAPVSVPSD